MATATVMESYVKVFKNVFAKKTDSEICNACN